MLEHIQLENWKNFSSIGFNLNRRVFLAGDNSPWKLDLLDAFWFLRNLAVYGLQGAIAQHGGFSEVNFSTTRSPVRIFVTVLLNKVRWSYEIVFSRDKIEKEKVCCGKDVLLDRPNAKDRTDTERLSQTYLGQSTSNYGFRDLVRFFKSIQYVRISQIARERGRPRNDDFFRKVADYNLRQARLKRIKTVLQAIVPLKKIEFTTDIWNKPYLRLKYKTQNWQTEGWTFDGTVRLIELLWTLLDGSGPLLLEEPEFSVPPEVVCHLPQLFKQATRRQILISTHSTELLRSEGISADEILRYCFPQYQ